MRGAGGAAGQNEVLEPVQGFVQLVDPLFELLGVLGLDLGYWHVDFFWLGHGDFGAEHEQAVLDFLEPVIQRVSKFAGASDADDAVEFVDFAVGLQAQVVLGYAADAEELGGAFVAGFCVDLGQLSLLPGPLPNPPPQGERE